MHLSAGGQVVLGERRPGDAALPDDLQIALREWAVVASALATDGGPGERSLVRRRGRQLAGRLADALGRPVDFHDPVTGRIEQVPGRPGGPLPQFVVVAPDPTPWSTGLPVAAYFAVLAALADIVLSRAFAEAFGWLWLPANVLVGLGLAPSLWLLRGVPFWRWPALGMATGLAVAWVCLLLDLLG